MQSSQSRNKTEQRLASTTGHGSKAELQNGENGYKSQRNFYTAAKIFAAMFPGESGIVTCGPPTLALNSTIIDVYRANISFFVFFFLCLLYFLQP